MIGWYVYDTTNYLSAIATTSGAAAAVTAATVDIARAGVPRLQCVLYWQVPSLLLLLLCGVNVHTSVD
jgi:hypothetical protein